MIKPPISMLPGEGLRQAAMAMVHGKKHDMDKEPAWKARTATLEGRQAELDAIMRHCSHMADGELIDPASGLWHAAHIAARALILCAAYKTMRRHEDDTDAF